MTFFQTSPSLGTRSPDVERAQTTKQKANCPARSACAAIKHFILPLAVIILMVFVQAAIRESGGETLDAASGGPQPAVGVAVAGQGQAAVAGGGAAGQPATAGIGTKVRDGNFEFVVTGVERPGKTFPGKAHTTLTAKGEFVIVRVDATNVSDTARRLDCQCQYLLNDKGQATSPSTAILYTKDALKYVQLIEPGSTVLGAPIVFDVAPGTKIVTIELHGSSTSQGVQVRLSRTSV